MKSLERDKAILLRQEGHSLGEIATKLGVAKSSVSLWVRDVELSKEQLLLLGSKGYSREAVEKRRLARLASEKLKRESIVQEAASEITSLTKRELWLMGVMLYWAEGGKTQRMVRFSNGDPKMIIIMMKFFRLICSVPESKFRGYIHIHPHLDHLAAEEFWSTLTGISRNQFFKTYRKPNKSSQNKKNSLPRGVMDIYVLDTKLFLQISGWAQGVFEAEFQ